MARAVKLRGVRVKRREWSIGGVLCIAICGVSGYFLWSGYFSIEQPGVTIERVHALDDDEGIFAYSRISPDGRVLAYTSLRVDNAGGASRYVRVVDLDRGETLFETRGLDGYWSPDGGELVFLDQSTLVDSVSILDMETGRVRREVAPPELGDYFSWGVDDGRSVIATNQSNYYFIENGTAVLPESRIVRCGDGEASSGPLISKDGRRVAAFEGRTIIVRNRDDCRDVIRTGVEGGKADFSYDGRYIAFHAQKSAEPGYEVKVVDLTARTIRTVADLPGSSFYPSWTADGRLSFRYDAPDFRGFVIASTFMSRPEEPLQADMQVRLGVGGVGWSELFVDAEVQSEGWRLVLVWAPWCTHCEEAFRELREAAAAWRAAGGTVSLFAAAEPSSVPEDVAKMRQVDRITAPALRMKHEGLSASGGANQLPAVLLFGGDRLVGRKLGTQLRDKVIRWLQEEGGARDGVRRAGGVDWRSGMSGS